MLGAENGHLRGGGRIGGETREGRPGGTAPDDRNQPGKGRDALSFVGETRRESGEFWGCRTVGEGILG